MGDIVQSKPLIEGSKGLAAKQIKAVLDSINVKYADYMLAVFGLVRGDAFEGILYTQRYAPQIILEIIKSVYKIDKTVVRFSVVMDALTVVSSDRNMANGPAFYSASEQIEKLRKQRSDHWLQVSFISNTIAQGMVESIIGLLTALTTRWTDRQREIAWAMDEYGQQATVSKKLDITPAAVSKQLKALNYNEYSLAWKSLEDYLEKAEEAPILKEDDEEPGYAAYYSIATRKSEQRDFAEAIPLFEKAIRLAKNELGDSDPQISNIYNGLVISYIETGKYEEAEKILAMSFQLQEQLPKSRIEYAATKNLLGGLFERQGKYDDALHCFIEAKEIVISTSGAEHPLVYGLNNNIATVHLYLENYETALLLYLDALKYAQEHDAPLTHAVASYNIARYYEEMRDSEKALPYAQKALEIRKEYLRPDHPELIGAEELIKELQAAINTKE